MRLQRHSSFFRKFAWLHTVRPRNSKTLDLRCPLRERRSRYEVETRHCALRQLVGYRRSPIAQPPQPGAVYQVGLTLSAMSALGKKMGHKSPIRRSTLRRSLGQRHRWTDVGPRDFVHTQDRSGQILTRSVEPAQNYREVFLRQP